MDVFKLSRNFFDWSFENPELITPTHSAIYFFAIEHCNRLWWKEKFWFPTSMAMEAIWIRKWETYNKAFRNLVEWWFIKEIEKSKNQYSSCIISIWNATPKNGKALDKALVKHGKKHSESTGESKGVIDIQETILQETRNKEFLEIKISLLSKDSIKYDFYNFLIWMGTLLEEELNEEEIDRIDTKLNEFLKRLWKDRAILEIESFIEHHRKSKTVFKSTIGRLNTWLSNKLK